MRWGKIIQTVTPIILLLLFLILGYLSVFQKPDSEIQAEHLTANAENPMNETHPNLKITIIKEGGGATAESGKFVRVFYRGTLSDGTQFDQNMTGEGFQFLLGGGQVIEGWELGIQGMKVGEKRTLIIPPDLGYGKEGYPGVIPPNAELHFDVELLDVHL